MLTSSHPASLAAGLLLASCAAAPADAPDEPTGEGGTDAAPARQDPSPTAWSDVTAEVGLPDGLLGATVSVGDVDGDGRLDLLLGGHADLGGVTELYVQVADGSYAAVDLGGATSGEAVVDGVLSTLVVDLDGDGRPELLLGTYFGGQVQVLWNQGGLAFLAETVYASPLHPGSKVASVEAADLDRDGWLDLYVSIKFPSSSLRGWESTHPNPVLRGGPDGFVDVTEQWSDLDDCATRQTFAAIRVPGAARAGPDVLYIANDLSEDCAYDIVDGAAGDLSLDPAAYDALDPAFHSMGLDWAFEPGAHAVLVVSTNVGFNHLVRIGDTVEDVADRLPAQDDGHFGWGAAFFDADNDGDQDLAWAAGLPFDDPAAIRYSEAYFPHGHVATDGQLFYYERLDDGSYADASATAGPLFEPDSGEWYGLGAVDLDADGCVDLVAAPREILHAFPHGVIGPQGWAATGDAFTDEGPGIRILRGACPAAHGWVGFEVPAVPGLIVELTRDDGSVRRTATKGLVGVGSGGPVGRVHFGLGPELEPDLARLLDADGQLLATIEDPVPSTYQPLAP